MPNILIHPDSGIIEFNPTVAGSLDFNGLTGSARINYRNVGEINITSLNSENLNRFSVDGNNGRLFDVKDSMSMSGSIFSVNNSAGLPIFEILESEEVIIGEYGSRSMVVANSGIEVARQISLLGQEGDPYIYNKGSVWFNSRDGSLRTRINTVQNSLALGKTFASFKATDSYGNITASASTGTRNNIRMLQFDAVTTESSTFIGVVPSGINLASGITARLFWMTTATVGNVMWSISFEDMNTDLDVDSFSTATSGTFSTNATAGILNVSSLSCTNIDNLRDGEIYRVKVTRAAPDVLDTLAFDSQLVLLELQATL